MHDSICGVDCANCKLRDACNGCVATGGRPFGKDCVVAKCYQKGKPAFKKFEEKLIAALNALDIENMDKVTSLNALKGSFINIEYPLPSGQIIRFWDDDKIYLGTQLCKKNSDRCYGLAADETYLMVCEYAADGTDAEIILFKRWNRA